MHRLACAALLVVALVVLGGCGGGEEAINLGDNAVILPPVGTAATSPTVAKFGPLANYLPPSGTVINYKTSGLLGISEATARFQFVAYDNTAGTMTVDMVTTSREDASSSHCRYVFWIKVIGGQSYCWKRKKIFYDEVRAAEFCTFTPGVLMGLFSSSPVQLSTTFSQTGGTGDSHTFTTRHLGTQDVSAGGTTYTCAISELRGVFPGDITRLQIYWAPGVGPVMAGLTPAMQLTQKISFSLPRWAKWGGVEAGNVDLVTP